MAKPYIAVESGLFKLTVFYIKDILTIGSEPENDICLNDPSVSDEHAIVYFTGKQAIIEDIDSRNGTFVNDEQIQKAILSDNDVLKCGDIILRYVEDTMPLEYTPEAGVNERLESQDDLTSTSDVPPSDVPPKSSNRLVEAISQIPLFKNIDDEGLVKVAEKARLVVFDPNQIIVRQGDIGNSL
ncbi:FHA domain-containing protein, partial [Thermodesulfobacteriota bacterium]